MFTNQERKSMDLLIMDSPRCYTPKFGDDVVGSYPFTRSLANLSISVYTPRCTGAYVVRSNGASILIPSHELYFDESPHHSEDLQEIEKRVSVEEEFNFAQTLVGIVFGSQDIFTEDRKNIFDTFDVQSDCSSDCSDDDDSRNGSVSTIASTFDFPGPSKSMQASDANRVSDVEIVRRPSSDKKFVCKRNGECVEISMNAQSGSLYGANSRISLDVSCISNSDLDLSRMSAPNLDVAQILNDKIAPIAPIVKKSSLYSELEARGAVSPANSVVSKIGAGSARSASPTPRSRSSPLALQNVLKRVVRSKLSYCVRPKTKTKKRASSFSGSI